MKIGIDFDDVICDFTGHMVGFRNSLGDPLKYEDVKSYDWFSIASLEEFRISGKTKYITPIEHALESLAHLFTKKDELCIITARPIMFKEEIEEWLDKHLKKDKIKVIFSGSLNKKKSEVCKEMGIKLIIEDSGENALDCAKQGITAILFDKPWNQGFKHEKIIRIKNWKEAIEKINALRT